MLVFDLDGTLFDTMGKLNEIAQNVIFKYYGLSVEFGSQLYKQTSGLPFRYQLERIFPEHISNDKASLDFENQKVVLYQKPVALFPDVLEHLTLWKSWGLKMAVSSNDEEANVKTKLAENIHLFHDILGHRPGFLKGKSHFDELQKHIQKRASGYDFITQAQGGVVQYQAQQPWPKGWSKCPELMSNTENCVHIYVGGKGAHTSSVSADTLAALQQQDLMQKLLTYSEHVVTTMMAYLGSPESVTQQQDFFAANKTLRELFALTPHFPHSIAKALSEIHSCDQTWTFKTTGAGGEDALLLFAHQAADLKPAEERLQNMGWHKLSYKIVPEGMQLQ